MKKIVNSLFQENTYLISFNNDLCYVIDPGSDYKKICSVIDENYKGVKAILLTHGHFDHFMSTEKLVEKYKTKVYMSNEDKEIASGEKSLIGTPIDNRNYFLLIDTTDAWEIGKIDKNIFVYETPGHSKGSVCFHFKKENILFSGDTMFYHGMGRVDLYGGNYRQIIDSLKFLCSLKEDIIVYPGHERATSIKEEKEYNCY